MPLKFDIQQQLVVKSERVKCVELHPELPWVLVSLYSGNITIYDYSNQTTVQTIENSVSPVRAAKFVVRKQWIIVGADDLLVRVYNYNTMEKIKTFEAHKDYIRSIIVHPTQSYLITTSDDSTIQIWDFEQGFSLVKSLDDHINYVMMCAINPRDTNTFCSGSLDRSIKVWSFSGSNKPNFTLTGHTNGINCVDYYKGDKPYIISGGDDRSIKIWDYQTKQCVHTLEGHTNNISSAIFHHELPIIISSAEDGSVKIWHSQTFRLQSTLSYNMDRVWCIDVGQENSNVLAFGFDQGTVVVKIGSDEPIVSMNNGKLIWAKNLEIVGANLKAINFSEEEKNNQQGENLRNINDKELGNCDFYPTGLRHSPNGHMFAVFNDSEYSIFRSQNFKNCGFGSGTDFVWSPSGDYAVRESFSISIFKSNNTKHCQLKTDYIIQNLFSGPLLAAKSNEYIIFYDWETAKVIRRIDITAKKIYWNDTFTQICVASTAEFYVLQFKADLVQQYIDGEQNPEGCEDAFNLLYEIHEGVTSAIWVDDVFFFTNSSGKLNYSILGKVFNYAHIDKKKFLLGYIQAQNRLFLIDKYFKVCCYQVPSVMTQYQSAIASGNSDLAEDMLAKIPECYLDRIAKFLDNIEMKDIAFTIVKDKEHKFELALALNRIDDAFNIAQESQNSNQFRHVGDISLLNGQIQVAIKCFEESEDLSSLLLVYSSLGLKKELRELGEKAQVLTRMNIAFTCFFMIADLDQCLEVLISSKRIPEAAFFAQTYYPSQISEMVKLWKADMEKQFPLTTEKIADPMDYIEEDSFSDLKICLELEKFYQQFRENNFIPAVFYSDLNEVLKIDLFTKQKLEPEFDLSSIDIKSLLPELSGKETASQKITEGGVDEVQ